MRQPSKEGDGPKFLTLERKSTFRGAECSKTEIITLDPKIREAHAAGLPIFDI